MKRAWLIGCGLLAVVAGDAVAADANSCSFKNNHLTSTNSVNIVGLLQHPPRTKVTVTIDGEGDLRGFHREIVWDPTVGDGLKHDVLLPRGNYTILAYVEEERVQTNALVMTKSTQFTACDDPAIGKLEGCRSGARETLLVSKQRTVVYTSAMTSGTGPQSPTGKPVIDEVGVNDGSPRIKLLCEEQGVLELAKVPLATKQLYAASIGRGLLDQTAPKIVTDTLTILAEIAVERAKAGVMELVKQRLVAPICDELDLALLGLGNAGERALPRTCALLENMRLQDLLSSGRNLLAAAGDDVRLTLVPRIVAHLNVPAAAQDIAAIALELGNKLIDGSSADVAGIDLLFAQLDRLFRRSALGSFGALNTEYIEHAFATLKGKLGGAAYERVRRELLQNVLQRVLPEDPGAWLSEHVDPTPSEQALVTTLQLGAVNACKRKKDTNRYFVAADREACIADLGEQLSNRADWKTSTWLPASVAQTVAPEQLTSMVSALGTANLTSFDSFATWLETYSLSQDRADKLTQTASALLQRSCAIRVTVAIVKWCSGHDACTASDIGEALDHPEALFGPAKAEKVVGLAGAANQNVVENLCWNGTQLRLPTIRTPYIELATRALAFLTPPAKGEERKRVEAMLRWTFDLAKTLDDSRAASVQKLAEVLELFEKRDYLRAIAQALALARCNEATSTTSCSRPPALAKAMELLGVVASYMQVYDETKTADPAEAKAARKKAIETLIDSTTDRKERGRDLVVSLGSNVGMSYRWSSETRNDFGLRVPLGLSMQFLPAGKAGEDDLKFLGLHAGIQLADLGQFIGPKDDKDITWSSFVAPGIEAGFLIGQPNRTFAVTAHLSYAPTLTDDSQATWRFGLALSYYVPFLDLN